MNLVPTTFFISSGSCSERIRSKFSKHKRENQSRKHNRTPESRRTTLGLASADTDTRPLLPFSALMDISKPLGNFQDYASLVGTSQNTDMRSPMPQQGPLQKEPSPECAIEVPTQGTCGIPCKYWPKCKSGAKCKFYHPAGNYAAVKSSKPTKRLEKLCRFDGRCTREGCRFRHSKLTVAPRGSPSWIAEDSVCRYGAGCTREGCWYTHPSA